MDSASKRFFKSAVVARRRPLVLVASICLFLGLAVVAVREKSPAASAVLLALLPAFLIMAGRKKAGSGDPAACELRAVSSVRLPGGGRVHAVACGGKVILVGVSGSHICPLSALPADQDGGGGGEQ